IRQPSLCRSPTVPSPSLGLTVRPERGAALLFFPARADGTPDPRTSHEARPAVDEKWIAQAPAVRGIRGGRAEAAAVGLWGAPSLPRLGAARKAGACWTREGAGDRARAAVVSTRLAPSE
ncbi:unnamed protein product, partial [Prorocentrum cordatum]